MAAIEDFLADAKRRMDKSIEATHHEFNSIRTGRASPALLDRITIDYYGTPTPLKSLASISAPEARLLVVQPFDPGAIKNVERAIQESDLDETHGPGRIATGPPDRLPQCRDLAQTGGSAQAARGSAQAAGGSPRWAAGVGPCCRSAPAVTRALPVG